MDTIRFVGRVFPLGLAINVEIPEIKWKWEERNIDFMFRVKIDNSIVTVECDLDRYEWEYFGELNKRATDLARTSANIAAFAAGYGLSVVLEYMTEPDGRQIAPQRREEIPAESRSALNLDASGTDEMQRAVTAIITEPAVFMALDDLIRAVSSHHTQFADCGRVVDGIRRSIAPTLDGAAAWRAMHDALNIDRTYLERISRVSTGPRHGDRTFISGEVGSEVLKRTWAVMNRFLEYRKRGNAPLTAPEFPRLV